MQAPRLRPLLTFLLGAIGLYFGPLIYIATDEWLRRNRVPPFDLAPGLLWYLILVLGGLCAVWIDRLRTRARALSPSSQPYPTPSSPWRRILQTTVVYLGVLAWLATAALGVPAVFTSLSGRSIAGYKQYAQAQPILLTSELPRIESSVALPVLPGVIVVAYGAQIAGQAGGGGWFLYLWWGAGLHQVYFLPRWMS